MNIGLSSRSHRRQAANVLSVKPLFADLALRPAGFAAVLIDGDLAPVVVTMPVMTDEEWMAEALVEARAAEVLGEVPIGAVVVRDGQILGRGHNRREVDGDPLAHAELLALRQAATATEGWRVLDSTLYVTLEPCAMCAGALVNSRVTRLVYGAADPKAGFCGSLGDLTRDPRLNHRLEVTSGVLEQECGNLLRSFFSALRNK